MTIHRTDLLEHMTFASFHNATICTAFLSRRKHVSHISFTTLKIDPYLQLLPEAKRET